MNSFKEASMLAATQGGVVKQDADGNWLVIPERDLSPKEIQVIYVKRIQAKLDVFVRTRGYDDVKTCVGAYLNSHIPQFQKEAEYCNWLVSETWAKCYQILEEVTIGKRKTIPTWEELVAELPIPTWPE